MSHDRGCPCGREPYEYEDCTNEVCWKRPGGPRIHQAPSPIMDPETPVQPGSVGAPESSAPGGGLGCDRAHRQKGAQVPRATAAPIPSRPMPDYATVPARHMIPGISLYLEKGVPPGSFLMALLQNDLAGAVRTADHVNLVLMREWVLWLHNNLPAECHGSPERVEAWCDKLEDT